MTKLSHHSYGAGHPWYYLLGGTVPTLKEIREEAHASGYKGYLAADIEAIGRKQEPQRSAATKTKRQKLEDELRKDISRYRECARELRTHRVADSDVKQPACSDIHTAISLKHNHIYNGFANLKTLESLPEQQLDLFGM
ncbi:MAG: hypothetical protein ABJF50_24895 [Paracoccaceae bacterium]